MKITPVNIENTERFNNIPSGNFFSSEAWCACFDERLKKFLILDEKENPIGRFVAYEGGKSGFKTLITPPFAPHIGLSVIDTKNNPVKINTFRKQVIEAIASFIASSKYVYFKLEFDVAWQDMQPMIWKGINPQVRYTYRIDLNQSTEAITANLDANKRNKLNKASKEEFTISHVPDIELAIEMLRVNLRDKPVALHEPILRKILELSAKENWGIWSMVKVSEKIVAMNVCILSNQVSYNLLSAIDRSSGHNHGGTFSIYQSIMRSKEKGQLVFDFEGSGIPEIEQYFRSFGGEITPYFSVQGGKWPWPMILKWKQKKRPA